MVRVLHRLGGSLMVGAYSEYMVIDTACQAAVMGISFKPGGASPFLKLPASELCGLHVPLDTLWKADGADLRTRLLEAPSPDAKFRALEHCLLAGRRGRVAQRRCCSSGSGPALRQLHVQLPELHPIECQAGAIDCSGA